MPPVAHTRYNSLVFDEFSSDEEFPKVFRRWGNRLMLARGYFIRANNHFEHQNPCHISLTHQARCEYILRYIVYILRCMVHLNPHKLQ